MRLYLAGPMTGIPHFNYPAFDAAAAALRAEGHEVFNPADHDRQMYGTDVSNPTGDGEQAAREHGFSRRDALRADLSWICDNAQGIALLPGWKHSSGARAERALADALGLQIIELPATWGDTCPLLKIAQQYGVDYSVPLKIADHYQHGRDVPPGFVSTIPEPLVSIILDACRAVADRMKHLRSGAIV